ncbi:MAG: CaiB/BaiF CoA-transferase family protein [Chloroflexi bacterium]|nr:CaiB/BaiF CoA-transferase family protein [Chloroflexota bacterium]
MPKVFEGYTVIELADRRNQFVGKLMSDSGARVIQVEPVTGGDARFTGPFVNDERHPNRCLDYWWYNTGKESLAIDVTRRPGQDLLRRLLAMADVLVESTKPGTLAASGLDYAALSKANPKLIYASLTDFGQDGPLVDYVMNDPAHLAFGGQMGSTGYSEPKTTPIGGQGRQAYNMASVMMMHTITAALFEREMSGLGQHLDVSIHDCCAVCTERAVSYWMWYDEPFLRQTGQHAAPTYRTSNQVQAADGRYAIVTTPRFNQNSWVKLIDWMNEKGVAGELAEPQWMDEFYRAEQVRHGTAVADGIKRLVATETAEQVFLRGQGMGLPWVDIRRPEENFGKDHYTERGFWVDVEHEEIGKSVPYPKGFYLSDELGMSPARRAPHLGEHTSTILTKDLSLSAEQVEILKTTGVAR